MARKDVRICLFILIAMIEGSFCKDLPGYSCETPVMKYLKSIEIAELESGIDLIDCIYVINLDERPEKWERIKTILDQRWLKGNRVSAINGWEINEEIQKELAGPYPLRLRGGQLGCLLSHLSIIKDAHDRCFDIVWILEDDVDFKGDEKKIPGLLRRLFEIDPEWDIFYTDVDMKSRNEQYLVSVSSDFRPDQKNKSLRYFIKRTLVDKDIMKIGQRFGMHSLILSRRGIEKILDYFTHVYLWTAIDIDIHYIPDIREYSATQDIVTHNTSSYISDTEAPLENLFCFPERGEK